MEPVLPSLKVRELHRLLREGWGPVTGSHQSELRHSKCLTGEIGGSLSGVFLLMWVMLSLHAHGAIVSHREDGGWE